MLSHSLHATSRSSVGEKLSLLLPPHLSPCPQEAVSMLRKEDTIVLMAWAGLFAALRLEAVPQSKPGPQAQGFIAQVTGLVIEKLF